MNQIIAHLKSAISHPIKYFSSMITFKVRTDLERWGSNENLRPEWDERTILIAELIPSGVSVVEFGAARLVLPKHLKQDCHYQSVDLVKRTEDTICFDLNDRLAELPQHYDYAVFSGVLEYVLDLPRLMRWIPEFSQNVIFSYAVNDYLSDPITRRSNGWVNCLSNAEVLELIEESRLKVLSTQRWKEQNIYYCETS